MSDQTNPRSIHEPRPHLVRRRWAAVVSARQQAERRQQQEALISAFIARQAARAHCIIRFNDPVSFSVYYYRDGHTVCERWSLAQGLTEPYGELPLAAHTTEHLLIRMATVIGTIVYGGGGCAACSIRQET